MHSVTSTNEQCREKSAESQTQYTIILLKY